jgi:hypothetical protein
MHVLRLASLRFFSLPITPSSQALFPDTLSGVSVPEFLEGLTAFDDEIEARRQEAAAQDAVLRYVASVKEGGFQCLTKACLYVARMLQLLVAVFREAICSPTCCFSLPPSSLFSYFTPPSGSYEVGLKSVPKAGPIGSLRGTDNILSLTSEIYSGTPLVVQGSGAGADITAAGVIADMIDIATRGIFAERR